MFEKKVNHQISDLKAPDQIDRKRTAAPLASLTAKFEFAFVLSSKRVFS